MALCEGCQLFEDRVLDPDLIPESDGWRVHIHTNYEELSACAETFCDMCKFLRRELWYHPGRSEDYSHRQHIEGSHYEISVHGWWHLQDNSDENKIHAGDVYWLLVYGDDFGQDFKSMKFVFTDLETHNLLKAANLREADPTLEHPEAGPPMASYMPVSAQRLRPSFG
jgi:hypothetical protein